MIELRWAHQHRGYIEKERVLQFRTQVLQIGNGYTTGKDGVLHEYQRPQGYVWTEWQDVPEVDVPNESGGLDRP